MRRHIRLLLVPLLPLLACCSPVPARTARVDRPAPVHLNTIDPYGILAMTLRGDAAGLRNLADALGSTVLGDYARATYYRSVFQLARSSRYAESCYGRAAALLPQQAVPALRCGELLAGNDLILGNVSGWAHQLEQMRTLLYPLATGMVRNPDVILPGFGTASEPIDARDFFGFPRMTIVPSGLAPYRIPRVLPSGELPRPDSFREGTCALGVRCFGKYVYNVEIRINGHAVIAAVDTGSSLSLTPPAEARALGVRVTPGPFYGIQSGGSGDVAAKLGYVERLDITTESGPPVELRNAAVAVGGTPIHGVRFILGLSALRELGKVTLSEREITVDPAGGDQACHQPLYIASTLWGAWTPFFHQHVNGRDERVSLDTGENQYMYATSTASLRDTSRGEAEMQILRPTGATRVRYRAARIRLGEGPDSRKLTIAAFPDARVGFPYVFGVGILHDHDVHLDFAVGTACMVPTSRDRDSGAQQDSPSIARHATRTTPRSGHGSD